MLGFLEVFSYLVWIALGIALNLTILGYFLIPMWIDVRGYKATQHALDLLDKALNECRETGETTVTLQLQGIIDAEENQEPIE